MSELFIETQEKFKKSDALPFLKELSQKMTKEEFITYANTAMKSAYDKNRIKAVEYMLSFYEYDQPSLLMKIHLQVMLHDPKDFEKGKKMLAVLIPHYSSNLCMEVIDQFIKYYGNKEAHILRSKEIMNSIFENKFPENNTEKVKKPKI